MIYGTGIDIIEISRIEEILNRKEKNFINKILSNNEKIQCPTNKTRRIEYIAGRFVGKEAFAKAFGTGIGRQIGWKEIEILNSDCGKPFVNFKNSLDNKDFVYHISISHTKTVVIAQVVVEYK